MEGLALQCLSLSDELINYIIIITMFVPFTLFYVDIHLKRLNNHSQYSVEQIGSDWTRIDLRPSVFQKFSGGRGMPPDPPSQCGLSLHICALHKTFNRPAPLIKNIFLRLCHWSLLISLNFPPSITVSGQASAGGVIFSRGESIDP